MVSDVINTELEFLPSFIFPLEFTTMPILQRPIQYFIEDIKRAKNLLALTEPPMQNGILRDDILRSTWMIAVGACDAYFCDVYCDLISRTLKAKGKGTKGIIPVKLSNQLITTGNYFDLNLDGGWRWRNYARKVIEKESVLSLGKIKELMNIFLREKHKIIDATAMEKWILHKECKYRLVGITVTEYQKLSPGDKHRKREEALGQFKEHYQDIFQRRNDDSPAIMSGSHLT